MLNLLLALNGYDLINDVLLEHDNYNTFSLGRWEGLKSMYIYRKNSLAEKRMAVIGLLR